MRLFSSLFHKALSSMVLASVLLSTVFLPSEVAFATPLLTADDTTVPLGQMRSVHYTLSSDGAPYYGVEFTIQASQNVEVKDVVSTGSFLLKETTSQGVHYVLAREKGQAAFSSVMLTLSLKGVALGDGTVTLTQVRWLTREGILVSGVDTQQDVTVPLVPITGLHGSIVRNSVGLEWDPVSGVQYEVYRQLGVGEWSYLHTVQSSFTQDELTVFGTYRYKVIPLVHGVRGDMSLAQVVSFTLEPSQVFPQILSAVGVVQPSQTVLLSWVLTSQSPYQTVKVFRKQNGSYIEMGQVSNTTFFVDNNPLASPEYALQVYDSRFGAGTLYTGILVSVPPIWTASGMTTTQTLLTQTPIVPEETPQCPRGNYWNQYSHACEPSQDFTQSEEPKTGTQAVLPPALDIITQTMPDAIKKILFPEYYPKSAQPGKDSDGDGIPDDRELQIGTNPWSTDTDRDGVPDGQEFLSGSDPSSKFSYPRMLQNGMTPEMLSRLYEYDKDASSSFLRSSDLDSDGLSNELELLWGTDPHNPDTDGDTVTDGDEVNLWGTNPLIYDDPAKRKAYIPLFQNLQSHVITVDPRPLILGVAPAGRKYRVQIRYLDGKIVDVQDMEVGADGIFTYRAIDGLADGSFHVVLIDKEDGQEFVSPGVMEIDTTRKVMDPELLFLDNASVDGTILHTTRTVPTAYGVSYYGSRLMATWHSLAASSQVISDGTTGNFSIKPSHPLEVDEQHKLSVYSVTPDGVRSRTVELDFYIDPEKDTDYMGTNLFDISLSWQVILWTILCTFFAFFCIFLYRRKKEEDSQSQKGGAGVVTGSVSRIA